MNTVQTDLADVLILEPRVFEDQRGYFMESFNLEQFQQATGVGVDFVQDNHSHSRRHVLRGIHYQVNHPQGKLVRVVRGEVLDVVVDLRRGSPQFGQHVAVVLSEQNRRQLWIPPGYGHGFMVRSESADFLYKVTEYRFAEDERTLAWNDPSVGIDWGTDTPILSGKDTQGASLLTADLFD